MEENTPKGQCLPDLLRCLHPASAGCLHCLINEWGLMTPVRVTSAAVSPQGYEARPFGRAILTLSLPRWRWKLPKRSGRRFTWPHCYTIACPQGSRAPRPTVPKPLQLPIRCRAQGIPAPTFPRAAHVRAYVSHGIRPSSKFTRCHRHRRRCITFVIIRASRDEHSRKRNSLPIIVSPDIAISINGLVWLSIPKPECNLWVFTCSGFDDELLFRSSRRCKRRHNLSAARYSLNTR